MGPLRAREGRQVSEGPDAGDGAGRRALREGEAWCRPRGPDAGGWCWAAGSARGRGLVLAEGPPRPRAQPAGRRCPATGGARRGRELEAVQPEAAPRPSLGRPHPPSIPRFLEWLNHAGLRRSRTA